MHYYPWIWNNPTTTAERSPLEKGFIECEHWLSSFVFCRLNQGIGFADLLGLQEGIPVLPAGLAAAPQPSLPPVATQWQKPAEVPLEIASVTRSHTHTHSQRWLMHRVLNVIFNKDQSCPIRFSETWLPAALYGARMMGLFIVCVYVYVRVCERYSVTAAAWQLCVEKCSACMLLIYPGWILSHCFPPTSWDIQPIMACKPEQGVSILVTNSWRQ